MIMPLDEATYGKGVYWYKEEKLSTILCMQWASLNEQLLDAML